MTTVLLNAALVLVGSAATIAAFGGKTWREGQEPFWDRVTPRGWLSLICWVLALSLGLLKEFATHSEGISKDRDAKNASAQVQADADQRQAVLSAQLKLTQDQLDKAAKQISSLQADNATIRGQLVESQTTLSYMRGHLNEVQTNLTSAQLELEKQGTANLISALATQSSNVHEIWIVLPLVELAPKFDARSIILESMNLSTCKDVFVSEYIGSVNHGLLATSLSKSTNPQILVNPYFDGGFTELATVAVPRPEDYGLYERELGQQRVSGHYLVIRYLPPPDKLERADAFVAGVFRSANELEFEARPVQCDHRNMNGSQSPLFQKALLVLVLDQKTERTLSITLKALPMAEDVYGTVRLNFAPESAPRFMNQLYREVMPAWAEQMEEGKEHGGDGPHSLR
jgi:hypothetical protein